MLVATGLWPSRGSTKPTDLPVEQATQFDLVINMRRAKALGLTISPSLLLRGDRRGRNMMIERRSAEGDPEQLQRLAADLS